MTEPPDPLDRARLTALAEQFDAWYRQGVDDAVTVNETNEPRILRDDDTLAEHWRSRGFQWMSANLDRQRLMASRDDLAGQVARLTEERDAARKHADLEAQGLDNRASQVIRLTAEVTTLRGEVARLTQALRDIEWAYDGFCPKCFSSPGFGHTAICTLSAALRGATEERP